MNSSPTMDMRSAALADDFVRVAFWAKQSTPLAIRSLHLGRLPLTPRMAEFVDKIERGRPVDFSVPPPLPPVPNSPTRIRQTRSEP